MSKEEILAELPKLGFADRREIFERILDLQDQELVNGYQPDAAEKALTNRELEEYEQNPPAKPAKDQIKPRRR